MDFSELDSIVKSCEVAYAVLEQSYPAASEEDQALAWNRYSAARHQYLDWKRKLANCFGGLDDNYVG